MTDDSKILEDFSGRARLFPLPNVVLFPHVIQPLHIFEPRYRQMTADALAGDRLIAPVLLQPGWETDYEGRPPVHSMLCLGVIVADQQLPDGRYNLLLKGLSRGRIVEELPPDEPYRCAMLELLSEGKPPPQKTARRLRDQISEAVRPWFPAQGPAVEQLEKLLGNHDLALNVICDLLGFAVPLAMEAKQELLEELDIEQRGEKLVQFLQTGEPPKQEPQPPHKFPPPEFSKN